MMNTKTVGTNGIGSLGGIKPSSSAPSSAPSPVTGKPGDADAFKQALGQVTENKEVSSSLKASVGAQGLAESTGTASKGSAPALKFSSHAIERMHSRGISFPPETMRGIEQAIKKASDKGSKDTLVLAGDNALIVSVKNNTVVTVMDKSMMKENVFTNIDSTVVV